MEPNSLRRSITSTSIVMVQMTSYHHISRDTDLLGTIRFGLGLSRFYNFTLVAFHKFSHLDRKNDLTMQHKGKIINSQKGEYLSTWIETTINQRCWIKLNGAMRKLTFKKPKTAIKFGYFGMVVDTKETL